MVEETSALGRPASSAPPVNSPPVTTAEPPNAASLYKERWQRRAGKRAPVPRCLSVSLGDKQARPAAQRAAEHPRTAAGVTASARDRGSMRRCGCADVWWFGGN